MYICIYKIFGVCCILLRFVVESSTAGKERGSGLRVTDPNDMKQERVDSAASNRNDSLSRRATPRRHTVTMGGAKLPGYETYPEVLAWILLNL